MLILYINFPAEGVFDVDIDVDMLIQKIDDPTQIQIALPLKG